MRKLLISLSVLVSLLLILNACSTSEESGGSEVEGENHENSEENLEDNSEEENDQVRIQLAVSGTETHPITVAAEKFKEVLEEISDGAFNVEIYPNSQLGGEREMAELVRSGSIEMTSVAVDGAMPNWVPEGQVFSLPYLIRDSEHLYNVLDGKVGQYLTDLVEEQGWINLGYWELGPRNFTNNIRPIERPEDLDGLSIRVQESPIWFEFIETFNASPTPISIDELYTALSQGVVDGQENPLATINSQQFYEVQQYLSLDKHTYAQNYVLINPETWSSLTDDQRIFIQDAVDQSKEYIRNWVVEQENELVDILEEKGMEITEPDLEAFRVATEGLPDKVSDIVPPEIVEMIVDTE